MSLERTEDSYFNVLVEKQLALWELDGCHLFRWRLMLDAVTELGPLVLG